MYSGDKVQGLWTHLGLLNDKSITAKMSEVEASVYALDRLMNSCTLDNIEGATKHIRSFSL